MNRRAACGARLFIREWCEIRGLSMREVARRCPAGPTIGTISRYNAGSMPWTRDNLAAVAGALDIPPAWLMSRDAVEHHRLLSAWAQLGCDDREIVMAMIETMLRRHKDRA